MTNRLVELQRLGQSIWYDNIRRGLITSGELARMVDQDGLLGVTSNPAIFEKAVAGSPDYDQATKALVAQGVATAQDIYERLAIEDIQLAADIMYPVYQRTNRRDGYVSFEVSPYLANDTAATLTEARRLHAAVGRDNVMIKVPGTPAGIPAVQQLLSEGINVNVTLLFSVEVYDAVATAYMAGLEALAARGGDVSRVASVASFFISRIDSLIDDKVSRALDETRDAERRSLLKGLLGHIAIANAKLTYAHYRERYAQPRWQALAARGAQPQRLLWASTSTKNPKYPKTIYVDELIGADTVNTVPAETFTEYRTSGNPAPRLTENWADNIAHAQETMEQLAAAGISMQQATAFLLRDGVQKFADAFDKLLTAVEHKRQALLGGELAGHTYNVGAAAAAVQTALDDWRANGKIRALWAGDPSLWSHGDEGQWLGWLHIVDGQRDHSDHFQRLVDDVRANGFTHVLLLGMGGSSLCPDVLRQTFGRQAGFPELVVLDSTVPAQVQAVEAAVDLSKTLCIVSSKSGGTTEPNVFKQYFFEKVRQATGSEPGARFIAITDPGTTLHQLAKSDRFRHIYHGVPSIGGRYSALSNFGMVPAAIMGIDVPNFLDRTEIMVHSCAACVPPDINPGVVLGTILGTLARRGQDKVTLITSPAIGTLGAWLEQLLAESTGKNGSGLIPIDAEELGAPDVYGTDRLFVYVRLMTSPSPQQDAAVDALERAGHPVVRITLKDTMEVGQEFFRWEIATAVAGSILGINAFNQPDVEASKIATRRLTAAYEATGQLPSDAPFLQQDGIALYADPRNASAIQTAATSRTLDSYLAAHLARITAGDYVAFNAYVEMNEDNHRELQRLRHVIRDAKRVATTLGYGPRFLHSTGQLHKGGPDSGVFLQITSEDARDLPIPGQKYSFGTLKRAQAQGDFEVLAERGRRALRVHLGADVATHLRTVRESIMRIVAA